ncbi:hypothetical protein PsYK624_096440 [Phanerochaete sordida]|uniref:T6SS Phospholipase effector Tle1-like catalytic domain-containing protein n=1 Tax=Phanerochaete sordida TaxID=48140 RepID=A0A9P3GER7_9APHY|nr:hypothetical protein PsYK624_096440 [Phanerochaete sordida]
MDTHADRSPSLDSNASDDTLHDPISPSSLYDVRPRLTSLKGKASFADAQDTPARQDNIIVDAVREETAKGQKVWVPSSHTSRTIALCFDGTGDQFDYDNSNVVNLFSMLRKDDTTQQLVYYQPGIGTYTGTDLPIVSTISKTLDEMFAMNISTHIKDGYSFLMENYTDGDKICLFGFSRGAYTARALAGMLQKVGLLPRSNDAQLSFAYDMYAKMATDADAKDFDDQVVLVETFKRTFCREVKVEFLGVWDTVNSVGLIPRMLPFVYMNNGVQHLRHALSLDERRVRFIPSFASAYIPHRVSAGERAERRFEDAVNAADGAHCDVREVWFAGVHADVGGGSVKNSTRHALARIPLRWMIRETLRCGTGLLYDGAMLQQVGLSLARAPDGTVRLADLPPRLGAHELRAYPGLRVDIEEEQPELPRSWAAAVVAFLTAPFRALFGAKNHISDTARVGGGRYVLPSRMHPTHARALHEHHGRDAPLADPHALDPAHMADRAPLFEAVEELADALSLMHDQLSPAGGWKRLLWLAMEYLPARIRVERPLHIKHGADTWEWWSRPQDPDDRLVWQWVRNCGRGRMLAGEVIESGLRVHRSVKTRLEARGIRLKHTHRRGECYVPQVRPALPRAEGEALPVRLGHHEWNVDVPLYWEWVD